MERFLNSIGGNFLMMDIDGYKQSGKKAHFRTPHFRRIVKKEINCRSLNNSKAPGAYVAIDVPNYVVIDSDIKGDSVTPEQSAFIQMCNGAFPRVPSFSQRKYGFHWYMPRDQTVNLPVKGKPLLKSLCNGDDKIELLLDTPTIMSRETFESCDPYLLDHPFARWVFDFHDYSFMGCSGTMSHKQVTWEDDVDKPNAELRAYLGMLADDRCDDRETWFQVGCVCKALNDKAAFYDWSRQSAKFDPDGQDKMWDSLKHDSDFTLGTLIHYARQDSPEEYKAYFYTYERAKEQLEAQGIAFNERTKKLICDGVEISQVDAKTFLAPIQYYDPKKDEMKQVYPRWICDPNRKTYKDVVFEPYNPKQGDQTDPNVYNTFKKMGFDYVEGTTGEELWFMDMVIEQNCQDGEDEGKRRWIKDYICDTVQNPMVKPKTGVVIKGHAQGTGKGTLVELIELIVGSDLVNSTNNADTYFGGFNSGLNSNLVCVLEEMSSSDGVKYKEALKTFMTQEYNIINLKNKMPFKQRSLNRVFINSNQHNPVIEDRRFCQAQTNPKRIISQQDFNDFHTVWKNDQDWKNRVGSAMIDHKITSCLTIAPRCSASQVRQDGLISPIHIVLMRMDKGEIPLAEGRYIHAIRLKEAHFEACCRMGKSSAYKNKHFSHMKNWCYQEYGCAFIKQRKRIGGVQAYWVSIDLPLVVEMMKQNHRYPTDELYNEYYGDEAEPC